MAYRASPPRKVSPEWTKTNVDTAAEAVPARAGFVNLEKSTMVHSGGFAQGVYAIMPDKHDYDRLRFAFGPVTVAGTVTAATMAVYAMLSDDSVVLVGTSDLSAAGTFPPIEGENYQGVYAVIVESLTGTGNISLETFVQGVHQGYVQ